MTLIRAAVAAGAIAMAISLAGCASRSGTAPAAAAAPLPGIVHAVQMTPTYQFVPAEIRITAGDTVEWRNVSPFAQSVTAVRSAAPLLVRLPGNAAEFESGIVRPGDTYRYRFTTAGVYQYVSRFANGVDMIGTILVTERP